MYRRWIWPLVAVALGTCLLATSVVGEPGSTTLPPLTMKNYKEVAKEVDALDKRIELQEARLLDALESPRTRSSVKDLAVRHLLRLHRREIVQRATRKLALKGDPRRASGRSLGPGCRAVPFPYQDLLSFSAYHASRELMTAALSSAASDEVIQGVVRIYRDVWGGRRAAAIFRVLKSAAEKRWHPNYDRVLRQFETMPDVDVSGFPKKDRK